MNKSVPNIEFTKDNNLCTGCGICEGACPSKAISFIVEKGNFRPVINNHVCNNSKGCHRCYDICPGLGINFLDYSKSIREVSGMRNDYYAGYYLKCFTGYSNEYEIRYHSASGGMVTQFLIWLLEHQKIDGAIVTSFDSKSPLLVKTFIATTKAEILKAKSSKYSPVSFNRTIQDIKKHSGKRFVIVGLPCHIEGFRKYEEKDSLFKSKIMGYFGLYCSSGRSFYLTEYVMRERNIDISNLEYLAYRDNGCLGNMVAKGNNIDHEERFQNYYHPLRSIFVPKRCTLCIDHYAEFADVSFGDIHIQPYIQDTIGISSLVVRNQMFLNLLKEAKMDGVITLDEISVELLNKSQPMAIVKKSRNAGFIRIRNKLGKAIPHYGDQLNHQIQLRVIFAYCHTSLQQFIGKYKHLWFMIKYLKGKVPKE